MRTSPSQSSPVLQPASTDAAHRHQAPTNHAAQHPPHITQLPDVILKDIAAYLGKNGRDNWHLADATFKRAVFMATPHLKLVRPKDLCTLIAAHTDARGHIDCSHFKKITLSHSSFTDADLARLQKFTSLHEVDFSDCTKITGAGIAKLPRTVRVANFTGCNAVTDDDMATLPPKLEEVNFTDCTKITGAGVGRLPRTVRVADFTGCIGLANVGIDVFPAALEKVNFTDCVNLTDADIGKLPHSLRVANFTGCEGITDDGMGDLPPDLEEVNFTDCTDTTDTGLANLPRKVRVADFSGCEEITDDGMATLPPDLEEVNFTDCTKITGAGVGRLPRTVRVADFTGCIGLANIGIDAFPAALEEVNFTDCTNLTDADVARLPLTLRVANFTDCPHVSASMIERLRQRGVRIAEASPSFEPALDASHRRQRPGAAAIGPDRQP